MRSIILSTLFLSLFFIGCDGPDNPITPTATVEERIDEVLTTKPELSNFQDILDDYPSLPTDIPKGITMIAPLNTYLTNPTDFKIEDYLILDEITMSELVDGATFTTVSKKKLTVTVSNGKKQINGIAIDESNTTFADKIAVFGLSGILFQGPITPPNNTSVTYYVSYFEDGIYHSLKGMPITPWILSNTTPLKGSGGCSAPNPNSAYAYISVKHDLATSWANEFSMALSRASLMDDPKVGTYTISNATYDFINGINMGGCNLSINSDKNKNAAGFVCDVGDKDASVTIKITEVKILSGSGLDRTGYYKGTFEGTLYYISDFGAVPEKVIINSGKFVLPIGKDALLGDAPDPTPGKIVGKWWFKKLIEYEPEYEVLIADANNKEYLEFKANGEFTEYYDGATTKGTYRVQGSKLIITTAAGGTLERLIKELTDTQLVVNSDDTLDGERLLIDYFLEK